MPRCSFKNFAGVVCNEQSDFLEYVMLHDPHGRIAIEKYGCKLHMNIIIDDLMIEQIGYEKHMKACFKQIEKIDEQLKKGSSIAEERQKIQDARKDGLPEPKFDSVEELKAKKQEFWNTVKNIKAVLQKKRNKYCVYCAFPLNDPEEPKDQIGKKYSNADFKGVQGYRRYDALFHTECFITWYTNKFALNEKEMKYLVPERVGQGRLFSTPDIIG